MSDKTVIVTQTDKPGNQEDGRVEVAFDASKLKKYKDHPYTYDQLIDFAKQRKSTP